MPSAGRSPLRSFRHCRATAKGEDPTRSPLLISSTGGSNRRTCQILAFTVASLVAGIALVVCNAVSDDYLGIASDRRVSRPESRRLNASIRPPHQLDVLLRHRLLRQPGGFEGFRSSEKASQITSPSRNVKSSAQEQLDLDTVPPPPCDGPRRRQPDCRSRRNSRALAEIDPRPRNLPESSMAPYVPDGLRLGAASIWTRSNSKSGSNMSRNASCRRDRPPRSCARTISTFSCDIAYSDSPAASRASGGVANICHSDTSPSRHSGDLPHRS